VVQAAAASGLLWGVQLNALSLANLCAAAGLATEFTVHIAARAASASRRGAGALAAAAAGLDGIGGRVCRGVVATKCIGVLFLAFASTPLFAKYYFRMYATTLVICAVNALVLLPVLLAALLPERGIAPEAPISSPRVALRVWTTVRKAARRVSGRGGAVARQEALDEMEIERETASAMASAVAATDS